MQSSTFVPCRGCWSQQAEDGWFLIARHFGDATIQELAQAKGTAQGQIRALFRTVGFPLAPDKAADMTTRPCDVIGVVHDLSKACSHKEVSTEVRKRIEDLAKPHLISCLKQITCTPAQASKVRGTVNVLIATYLGKVGRAGMHPLLQRE